ncbi:MAG: DUF4397 domain-containing protein [Bacteroidales bacterium]
MKTNKLFLLLVALLITGSLNLFATSRVQVIHNSADKAAEVVDVWLDNTLLLDDFTFRTASPFIDAPSGMAFKISIKGPDSKTPDNPIWSQVYTLDDKKDYILIAEGIVSPSGYTPNKAFDIAVYDMAIEKAKTINQTDVLVHHGSTDAPTVDVYETGVGAGMIVDNLMYSDFAGYLELGTMDYVLEIRDETGENAVAAYQAPLASLGLEGAALTVVASGFLNPENNSMGEAFGLYVALPAGGELIALPVYEITETARVQVIHNAADMAAEVVDVWLNETLLLDNFTFRTASPFVDAPAGEEFTIAIQGPDSNSPENPIWSQSYTLEADETYVLVANGIVSATGYDPVQPFDIYVYDMGREQASNMDNTDVLVFHGSTDAPTVDVVEVGVGAGTIVNDLSYGGFDGYLELGTADYRLAIKDETGTVTVATYNAPLATLGLNGEALTIVASGFLNPDNNSMGEAFGLYVALASGGELVELPLWLSTREIIVEENVSAFPNPASSFINVQYSTINDADVYVEVYDILGSKIISEQIGSRSNQLKNHTLDVSGLDSGLYFVSIGAGESKVTKKIQVVN